MVAGTYAGLPYRHSRHQIFTKIKNQKSKIKNQKSKIKNQEPRTKNEHRAPNQNKHRMVASELWGGMSAKIKIKNLVRENWKKASRRLVPMHTSIIPGGF